jgi:hypothetical protein
VTVSRRLVPWLLVAGGVAGVFIGLRLYAVFAGG